MQNVDKWDDSKLVFKKVNMQGFDAFIHALGSMTEGQVVPDGENGMNPNTTY